MAGVRKCAAIVSLLLLVLALVSPMSHSQTSYLLFDEFSGTELDPSLWYFRTHPGNNAYADVSDGVLRVHSGEVAGSGGMVRSHEPFYLGNDVLVFETRAKVDADGGGHWGLHGDLADGIILFGVTPEEVFYLQLRASREDPCIWIWLSLDTVDPNEWHTYRIEATNTYAKWYVDNELIQVRSDNLPLDKPLQALLDSPSSGIDQISYFDHALVALAPPLAVVNIDIKPGSYPNSINLGSKGVLPVAVLTAEEFDASSVDPVTVLFAGAAPLRWAMEDVDYDGDVDLIFHFKTQDLDLDMYSTDATLTGQTYDGTPVEGTDTVNVVP